MIEVGEHGERDMKQREEEEEKHYWSCKKARLESRGG
jgi:hypothetical protein